MKLTGQEVVDLQALRQLRSGNKPSDGFTTFRGKPMFKQGTRRQFRGFG